MNDDPRCPECDGPMWDQRKSKWWGDGLGRSGKPKPVFKCKDKECDGVLWREDLDDVEYGESIPAPAGRAAAPPKDDRLIDAALRIATALEQISAKLSELKWTAPLSSDEVAQYQAEEREDPFA